MVLAHIQKKGFMDVIKNTGIRGLYHGFEPTIYRDISFNMAFFTIREIFVRVYRNHYAKDPNPFQRTLMGIISGTLASVVACPFDVVKTRIQGKDLKSASGKAICGLCTCVLCVVTCFPVHVEALPVGVVMRRQLTEHMICLIDWLRARDKQKLRVYVIVYILHACLVSNDVGRGFH
jgi:hypothetical protein